MSEQPSQKRKKQYKDYLNAELEAAATYQAMADVEKDTARSAIFLKLVDAELRHAKRWAEKLSLDPNDIRVPKKNIKISVLTKAAEILGTNRVIPWLLKGEDQDIIAYEADPEAQDIALEEREHAEVLRTMPLDRPAFSIMSSEIGHRFSGTGDNIRPIVMGVNDGLVSNFTLVMGVAGGTDNAGFVMLAGISGLLAGACSMAAGEYISVRSQRDLYEYQIGIEAAELEEFPEDERDELILIYELKGLSHEDASNIADKIMMDPKVTLDTMAREELGLDPDRLGSPVGAATSSFTAFFVGALIPILPYLLGIGSRTLILSAILSITALAIVGSAISIISGKNMWVGAVRMMAVGGVAATITFIIGNLVGVTIS